MLMLACSTFAGGCWIVAGLDDRPVGPSLVDTEAGAGADASASDATSEGGASDATSDADAGNAFNDAALPPCGLVGTPLFHVTMDDLASLSSPLAGSGAASSSTVTFADIGVGTCGGAVHFFPGLQLSYPEVPPQDDAGKTAAMIDYDEGTIMVWYRPDYDETDVDEHDLLRGSDLTGHGGVKFARTTTQRLRFQLYDATGAIGGNAETTVNRLVKDQWVHIAVSWKRGFVPRIFLDGFFAPSRAASERVVSGTLVVPSASARLGVGGAVNGVLSAEGWLDELRIYKTSLP